MKKFIMFHFELIKDTPLNFYLDEIKTVLRRLAYMPICVSTANSDAGNVWFSVDLTLNLFESAYKNHAQSYWSIRQAVDAELKKTITDRLLPFITIEQITDTYPNQ